MSPTCLVTFSRHVCMSVDDMSFGRVRGHDTMLTFPTKAALPYFWTTILCRSKLRSLPKPSTMASEMNSSCYQENLDAMYYPTHGTYRPTPPDHPTQHGSPTFCRSCHGPRICRRHVMLQPENPSVSSFVCLSLSILVEHVTSQNE